MSSSSVDPVGMPQAPRLTLRWLNARGIALLLALAALWQLAMSAGVLKSQFLPQPVDVGRAIGDLARSGALSSNFGHTLYVTIVGWLAAAALGIALGLLLGLSAATWRWSMASLEFLRALPAISFVPVAVLILGFSVKMELVVVIYVSLWPVLIGTIHGVRRVTPLHRDLGLVLHMGPWTRIRRLVLPTTAPFIFVGLQLSLSLSLALALVAEMIGNPHGVGQALIVAQNTLQPADMFAYVILIGAVGVALNALFLWFVRTAFPGTSSTVRTAA